jgi:prepilin-type N-terminal cleavage/methylation domain-containing protein
MRVAIDIERRQQPEKSPASSLAVLSCYNPIMQKGFTVVEVLVALGILLVGIVAVAQLVPTSISLNSANRKDSMELVFAQRELEQFFEQPLQSSSFIDALGNTCPLGDPTLPNQPVGSPIVSPYGVMMEDFSQAAAPGYSFVTKDPGTLLLFETRWTVITAVNAGGMVTSKRYILGVQVRGGAGIFPPVTLDTLRSQ